MDIYPILPWMVIVITEMTIASLYSELFIPHCAKHFIRNVPFILKIDLIRLVLLSPL